MKWLLMLLVVLVCIGVVMWTIGSRLPREHNATVRGTFSASPDSVWTLIADPIAAASWRSDLTKVERINAPGTALSWREHSRSGAIAYMMVEQTPRSSQITRITDTSLPYGGQWEFTLAERDGGSELTITERGFVVPPLFRLLSRYVFGYTSSLKAYHHALANKIDPVATITVMNEGR
jgi:hypothetical protein